MLKYKWNKLFIKKKFQFFIITKKMIKISKQIIVFIKFNKSLERIH